MNRLFKLGSFLLMGLVSEQVFAELKYCSGEIVDLIARDSLEGVQVRLKLSDGSGTTGYAAIKGTDNTLNDHQQAQVSMLLAAYMASKSVTLELNTNGYTYTSCADFQKGLPVRYVRLR